MKWWHNSECSQVVHASSLRGLCAIQACRERLTANIHAKANSPHARAPVSRPCRHFVFAVSPSIRCHRAPARLSSRPVFVFVSMSVPPPSCPPIAAAHLRQQARPPRPACDAAIHSTNDLCDAPRDDYPARGPGIATRAFVSHGRGDPRGPLPRRRTHVRQRQLMVLRGQAAHDHWWHFVSVWYLLMPEAPGARSRCGWIGTWARTMDGAAHALGLANVIGILAP